MDKKRILFIVGTNNQTSQMYQIATHLTEYDCYFTQFYASNLFIKFIKKTGILDHTIISDSFRANSEKYLMERGMKIDYEGKSHKYDLAILCTDLVIPDNLKCVKKIWVQEGMIDKMTTWSKIVKTLGLPPYLGIGTSLNGGTNLCDIYCSASEGYTNYLVSQGTERKKIITTGIPNFDNVAQYVNNDFKYKDYVLVATSDIRELYGIDDRESFIRECVKIADGRKLIFKLHPNEIEERATREIMSIAPEGTLVYHDGNVNHMVANCEELITQYSTVVYLGLALGKKVYSYFDVETLKQLTPLQNGGSSAANIAVIATQLIENKYFIRIDKPSVLTKFKAKSKNKLKSLLEAV